MLNSQLSGATFTHLKHPLRVTRFDFGQPLLLNFSCDSRRAQDAPPQIQEIAERSRPHVTCNMRRKIFGVFADSVQKRGLEFV